MEQTQRMFWNDYYRHHKNIWRKQNYFEEDFSGKEVLELGCGNGKSLAGIIETKPLKLVGLDFSEIAIRIAKERFPKGIEFIRGECQDLPFKNNEFDFVIANHVIGAMQKSDREKSIKEINRVLKKGGKLIFSDFAVGDLREKGELIERNTYQKKNGVIQHFFIAKELEELLSNFDSISVKINSNYLLLNKQKVLRTEVFAEAVK